MSRWIISTYEAIVEIALWVAVLGGAALGFAIGGAIDAMNRGSGGGALLGLLIGGALAFFVTAILVGGALILSDILRRLTEMQRELGTMQRMSASTPAVHAPPAAQHAPLAPRQEAKPTPPAASATANAAVPPQGEFPKNPTEQECISVFQNSGYALISKELGNYVFEKDGATSRVFGLIVLRSLAKELHLKAQQI